MRSATGWIRRRAREFGVAATLLTRLPAGWLVGEATPLPRCDWAFPVVGALVGGLAGAAFRLATGFGLTAPLAAIIALAALVLLTGAMHEDGLADTADGLSGGSSDQALAIMRDSRIGSYGTVALVLSLAYRATAVAALGQHSAVTGLVVAATASRAAMLGLPVLLAPARGDGLGAGFGRPPPAGAATAVMIAALVSLALLSVRATAAIAAAVAAALGLVAWLASRQFGGYTGDTLGAAQQVAECAALSVLVATVTN